MVILTNYFSIEVNGILVSYNQRVFPVWNTWGEESFKPHVLYGQRMELIIVISWMVCPKIANIFGEITKTRQFSFTKTDGSISK